MPLLLVRTWRRRASQRRGLLLASSVHILARSSSDPCAPFAWTPTWVVRQRIASLTRRCGAFDMDFDIEFSLYIQRTAKRPTPSCDGPTVSNCASREIPRPALRALVAIV